MPPLETGPEALITAHQTHTVEIIDRLNDAALEWEPIEADGEPQRLFCDMLTRRVNAYDTAQLSMEIGDGLMQPGDDHFADWQPPNIVGKFVRITISQAGLLNNDVAIQNRIWVGYILSPGMDRSAVKRGGTEGSPDPDQNKLTGAKIYFTCVGLEYFLDRKQVTSARVNSSIDPFYVEIERPLIFNGDASVSYDSNTSRRGNRMEVDWLNLTATGQMYLFSDGTDSPALWSITDAVRYLLLFHRPADKAGDAAPVDYVLQYKKPADGPDAPDDAAIIDGIFPTVNTENKTVMALLNELMKPERGLCWWLETPNTNPGAIVGTIRVASRTTEDITMPGGGELPMNANPQTLDFDRQVDVDDIELRDDRSRNYHQVKVRGARMTVTMTVGIQDDTLEPDWSTALENAYKAGVDPLDAAKNDNYRRDEKFLPVYAWFRIPADWDGTVGDGVGGEFGGEPKAPAIPSAFSPSGTPIGDPSPINPTGLRILNTTRLLVGYNYAVDASNPTPIHDIPSSSTPDFVKPFAFFGYEPAGSGAVYIREADKLNKQLGPNGDLTTSYHLGVQQSVPGITLRAVEGWNHSMAGDRWTAATAATASAVTPEIAFEEGLTFTPALFGATVTIEADKYAEAVYPTDYDHVPDGAALEILTIDAGDKYRLDYLAPHTVLWIDHSDAGGSAAVLSGDGGVIRNDQNYLQDIARLAYDWYRVERQPLVLSFKNLRDVFDLGMLITTIGEGSTLENVNTVVSQIQFDLINNRMTITTDGDRLAIQELLV